MTLARISSVLLALSLGACVPQPPAFLAAASNPGSPAPRLGYDSVIGQTKTFRPGEPKNWEELNRRVGPTR